MTAPSCPSRRAGFQAGLVAGLLLALTTQLVARLFGGVSLAELAAYRIIGLLPLALFSFGIATLGALAKQLLLALVLAGQMLVAGGLGWFWARTATTVRSSRPWTGSLWTPDAGGGIRFGLLLFVLAEVALLPLLGGGWFGTALLGGAVPAAVVLLLEALVYGVTLGAVYARLVRPAETTGGPLVTRREFARQTIVVVAALAAGGAAVSYFSRRARSGAGPSAGGGRVGNGDLPPEVTPTADFYQVSKNFADPKVELANWKLEVTGLVERPYTLTYDAIKALPPVADYRTLCCISNEVGGDLISNAAWRGVRLADLLEQAGVKPGAVDLKLTAADGYTESFPIAKALSRDVLVVYEMNGEPLNDKHGFPLRLLVPDIYGMKNVKWVTKLEVVGFDYKGYWQERGWSDPAIINTMSRIDFPRAGQTLPPGTIRTGGVAFAGARGIAKVELSADSGRSWREARLRRPTGPYAWVLWSADADLAAGDHTLVVRATDGAGQTQTRDVAPPAPDGATGWHSVPIRLVAGVPAPAARQPTMTPTEARPSRGLYYP